MHEATTHTRIYCDAKTRSGGTCKNAPLNGGNGRCRMHNGRAKAGIESPTYKHGRHSKYLPYPFADIYNEAQNDEQLLSVKQEIALSDAMLISLLPDLESGESGEAWKSISKLLSQLERDYQNSDAAGMAQGLRTMRAITSKQVAHYAAYDAINKQADHRRKLVETELRISLQGERAITVELFAALMSAILKTIEMGVENKDERLAVIASVYQIVS